jgi:predicted nucleotidyltransferase
MSQVEELSKSIAALPEVELVVLFGSEARGRARRGSDVDLAVKLAPETAETRRRVRQAIAGWIGKPVDLVFLKDAPPLLRMEIARHGKALFQRHPHGWANFKAKAMLDWGDWAPYARRMWAASLRRLREEAARGPA